MLVVNLAVLCSSAPVSKAEDSDEEIPSDSDVEEPSQPPVHTDQGVRKRKIKMDDYPGFLKKQHEEFKPFRFVTHNKF